MTPKPQTVPAQSVHLTATAGAAEDPSLIVRVQR